MSNRDWAVADGRTPRATPPQASKVLGDESWREPRSRGLLPGVSAHRRKNERLGEINRQLTVEYVIHGFHGNTLRHSLLQLEGRKSRGRAQDLIRIAQLQIRL